MAGDGPCQVFPRGGAYVIEDPPFFADGRKRDYLPTVEDDEDDATTAKEDR
jgi:hypothetical protein